MLSCTSVLDYLFSFLNFHSANMRVKVNANVTYSLNAGLITVLFVICLGPVSIWKVAPLFQGNVKIML